MKIITNACAALAVFVMITALTRAAEVTPITDIVYLADGSTAPVGSTITISWPRFTSVTNHTVPKGSKTVAIGADGSFTISLEPNDTATPAFTYTVRYNIVGQSPMAEYWTIPTSTTPQIIQQIAGDTGTNTTPIIRLVSKGQIPVFDGANMQALSPGSDGTVLNADSSQATGYAWKPAGTSAAFNILGNQPVGANMASIFSTNSAVFNGGTGIEVQNCASPQNVLSTCNSGHGVFVGDIGVNALLTPGTEAIQMGVLRDGWSLLLDRNMKYDAACAGGPCWAPIIGTASYGYANDLLELGAEGVSIHVDPAGFGSNHWGISSMAMSWRPDDVRAPDASGNDSSITTGAQTVQVQAPIYISYHGADDTHEYYHGGATRAALHILEDGTGLNVPIQLDNMDSAHRAGSMIQFRKSGGNPSASGQTIVTANDNPMQLYSYAYDGSAYQLGSSITTFVSGTPAAGSVCQDMRLNTGSAAGNLASRLAILCNGNVGIGNTAPTSLFTVGAGNNFKVDSTGSVKAFHYGGNSSAPTVAAEAGAGTGSTGSVFGNDADFTLLIHTGTSPASGVLATVTFNLPYATVPRCIAGPSSISTAGLGQLYSASGSTSAVTFGLPSAPGASVDYQWYVHCFN